MKLMNERNQVRSVVQRWKKRYPHADGRMNFGDGYTDRSVAEALSTINTETATAADVAKAIGNNSWVSRYQCYECGNHTWNIVELGQEGEDVPSYDEDSWTTWVCQDCLKKALALFEPIQGNTR